MGCPDTVTVCAARACNAATSAAVVSPFTVTTVPSFKHVAVRVPRAVENDHAAAPFGPIRTRVDIGYQNTLMSADMPTVSDQYKESTNPVGMSSGMSIELNSRNVHHTTLGSVVVESG